VNRLVLTRHSSGFSLIELLVASLLTLILLLGVVQLFSTTGTATRLQENQALLQDHARYATRLLSATVRQAGYSPEPWNDHFAIEAIAPGTENAATGASDRLVVRSWSDLNCFDNRNPDQDGGKPRFYIRESSFDLNSSGHLTRSCRYGPSVSEMVSLVRRQGLVPGVESIQFLFGDDQDRDGNVDRWVCAGQWSDERQVLGIRIGMLLAGPDSVRQASTRVYDILDVQHESKKDGKLRHAVELSLSVQGRGG